MACKLRAGVLHCRDGKDVGGKKEVSLAMSRKKVIHIALGFILYGTLGALISDDGVRDGSNLIFFDVFVCVETYLAASELLEK